MMTRLLVLSFVTILSCSPDSHDSTITDDEDNPTFRGLLTQLTAGGSTTTNLRRTADFLLNPRNKRKIATLVKQEMAAHPDDHFYHPTRLPKVLDWFESFVADQDKNPADHAVGFDLLRGLGQACWRADGCTYDKLAPAQITKLREDFSLDTEAGLNARHLLTSMTLKMTYDALNPKRYNDFDPKRHLFVAYFSLTMIAADIHTQAHLAFLNHYIDAETIANDTNKTDVLLAQHFKHSLLLSLVQALNPREAGQLDCLVATKEKLNAKLKQIEQKLAVAGAAVPATSSDPAATLNDVFATYKKELDKPIVRDRRKRMFGIDFAQLFK